jgi:hypothetical protein
MITAISSVFIILLTSINSSSSFQPHARLTTQVTKHQHVLSMVLEKPKEKKLAKIEALKIESDHLIYPLKQVK